MTDDRWVPDTAWRILNQQTKSRRAHKRLVDSAPRWMDTPSGREYVAWLQREAAWDAYVARALYAYTYAYTYQADPPTTLSGADAWLARFPEGWAESLLDLESNDEEIGALNTALALARDVLTGKGFDIDPDTNELTP